MIYIFKNRLEEGCVYMIDNFFVHPYDMLYRPLRRCKYLEFSRWTRVAASSIEPWLFKRYVFDLAPFEDLTKRINDDHYLTGFTDDAIICFNLHHYV